MSRFDVLVIGCGPAGERVIPIAEFFYGPFEPALQPNEILTEIRIPQPGASSGGAYAKMERKVGDYAAAAVAVQLALAPDGTCQTAGIGLTNVGLTAIQAEEAEKRLVGSTLDDEAIQEAAALAAAAADPEHDARGSVEYKRSLIQILTVRALHKAAGRARGESA